MANTGQLPADTSEDMSLRFDIGNASNTSNVTSNISLETQYENLGYSPATNIEMSHWYGANTGYVSNDGVNGSIQGGWTRGSSYNMVSNDWSIVCWVRMKSSTKKNQNFWDFNTSTAPNSNNRIFLQYSANLNRLVARVRTNSTNFDRQWALHSNSGVTGITNSSTGWTTGQRGNVNSENWTMLTVTYDASQTTGANAFKMYWNAGELTSQAASNNGSRTNFTQATLGVCDAIHNTPSAGCANIDIDEWKYFETVLSSTNVSTLYNSGTIRNNSNFSAISVTQTQASFDLNSDQAQDVAGYWDRPNIETGALRQLHTDGTGLNI